METCYSDPVEDTVTAARAPLQVEELLHYAALLAGLGQDARNVARQLAAPLSAQTGDGRTCIDGGSSVMLALLAPGGRNLRVLTRSGPAREGMMPWLRTHYLPGGKIEHWHSETYIGEPPNVWNHALSAAERAGGPELLRRIHAVLGLRGRLYSVNWALDGVTPQASVGWQLERAFPVDDALAAIGCPEAWPVASELLEGLLGYPPRPRRGPWSISLLLGNGEPRLRLGSTNWAFRVEDTEKRRRFASVVQRWGGDRRFAEAIYKLVESTGSRGPVRSIGRAVELELLDGRVELAEFYLCIP